MGSVSGDEISSDSAALKAGISDSDRAFLLASAAWGGPSDQTEKATGPDETAPGVIAALRDRLAPAWLHALEGMLYRDGWQARLSDRDRAMVELRGMHEATARVDLSRVHFTWLVRALQEESPAVQRFVTASLGEVARHRVQAGLLLDSRDLQSERPAAAEVASWVTTLWTERLVGGEAERADDAPALSVLVRLTPRAGYRLCRMTGLCKLVLAGERANQHGAASGQARFDWLAARLAGADDDLRALAQRDVTAGRAFKIPPRREAARIGLTTIARLLADIEPFRVRWALQHWPYPVAKLIRSLLSSARPSDLLIESESLILRTAWDRLHLEGRLAPAWLEPHPSLLQGASTGAIARRALGPESSFFPAK